MPACLMPRIIACRSDVTDLDFVQASDFETGAKNERFMACPILAPHSNPLHYRDSQRPFNPLDDILLRHNCKVS